MLKQLAAFIEGIRTSCLLKPAQMEQIATWATAEAPNAQAMAKEIVRRGWLTAYQVKMFWKARGTELFLGQYVLLDRLGEGGMGEVFRARHRRMERIVALKVIRRERLASPAAVKRFGREIQAAAQLSHENIVMAYDADQAGDRHFFAMEYVEGVNLTKLVHDSQPVPIGQACECIRQAAIGLQHAHERGMIHRDIKPSNLLLSKRGVLKILDMGLARLAESPDGEPESRITQEGLVVGTPDFLAPEQARNSRTADSRADIYALGCTFYYVVNGHPPYPVGTPTEKMLRHTTDPVPAMTRPDVPPVVCAIIQRMMAKKPDDRYQTSDAVAHALQTFAANPFSLTMPQPLPKFEPLAPAPLPSPDPFPTALMANRNPQPRTDSDFQLPAPVATTVKVRDKTRWNLPIALGVGLIVLALAAGGIYIYFKNNASAGSNLPKQVANNHGISLTLIESGKFNMGSPDNEAGRSADEGPVHAVQISQPFYFSTGEITLKQWVSVMKKLPHAYREDPEDLDAPVANISMRDVTRFIEKLNSDGESRKPGWEYRLPTEAEWEYACRAGSSTRFHTGGNLGKDQAFFNETGATGPRATGQFPANPWGLRDMHGNVAEWVGDFYDDGFYGGSPAQDPKGPEQRRSIFVVRGGSYLDPAEQCRSARRRGVKEETISRDIGFRIAYVQVRK